MIEEFLWPGGWLIELLKPIFSWLADGPTAPSLAMWMLYAALFLWLIYVAWVAMISAILRHGRKLFENESETTLAAALPKIHEQIATRFQRLPIIRGPGRSIRHTWKEFDETLIKPEPDDPRAIVCNTVRPQTFFNQVAIGPRFRLFGALPGIFVGLGLLLTFFGLVSALYFATEGIEESDIAKSQEALKHLLQAASFKFYTSIAGLAASLWFVLSLRIGARVIDGSFDKLSNELERCLRFATPEDKIFELARLAERQLEQLEKLNTDIGVAIGKRVEEALNNTLPTHLAAPLQQLSERLDHVTSNLNKINVEALQKMGQEFSRELLGATQGQFQELATVLGDLKASLGGLKKNMDESGSVLAENLRVSANEVHEAIGSAGENAVARIGGAAQALRESLASASEEFSRTELQIAAHRKAMQEIASSTETAGEAAKAAAVTFRAAAEPLQAVAQDIASTAQQTRATLTETADAVQAVTSSMQQTGENLAKAAEKSEEASRLFEGVDASLSKILDDLVGRTQDAIALIQKYVSQLDRLFSESIDRLAGGVENLGEIASSIEAAVARRDQKKEILNQKEASSEQEAEDSNSQIETPEQPAPSARPEQGA